MRLRNLLIANAAGAVVFGLLFALWAPTMLGFYGVSSTAQNLWHAVSFARLAGAVSICLGILLWAARDIAAKRAQRRVATALLVANSFAFLIAGAQQIAIWETTMGTVTVAGFFLFAMGYTYYLFGAETKRRFA